MALQWGWRNGNHLALAVLSVGPTYERRERREFRGLRRRHAESFAVPDQVGATRLNRMGSFAACGRDAGLNQSSPLLGEISGSGEHGEVIFPLARLISGAKGGISPTGRGFWG